MKILHVLYSDKYSGAENVVCQIVEMFKNDKNIEMAYCSRDGQIRGVLQEKGIKFYPVKNLSQKELRKVVSDFKPNIIHAHDFRASIVCSKFSKKISVLSHLHNNPPWLRRFCLKTITYAMSCYKYDKILTVSNSVFDEFIFGKHFKNKQICVGNPINIDAICEKSNAYSCEKQYDICFCGRLCHQKNPFFMLDILSKLSVNFSAVLIGDGELKFDIERKIKELNLNDKVEIVGFQDNPYPIIKHCRMLFMPSAWEGFGLVAVEAMALGLPVVCSNVGGLPTIVNDMCGKVCKCENDYVEEFNKLLTDECYLMQKSDCARKRSNKMNNYFDYKKELAFIYEDVKNI